MNRYFVQVGIGFAWLVLTAMWLVLMVARLLAGDEYHHQSILALICSGLSTQAFNQATVVAKLEARDE